MYIIDFDGTLIDVWDRYYSIFNDFWGINKFNLDEYKFYKREYQYDDLIARKKIGLINEKDILEYKNFKKKKIEDINYLSLDNLLVTRESLQDFFFENDAIILTIRNNKKNLFKQLNILNIDFLRDKIISLNNDGIYTKASWVRKNINRNEKKIVVGDSEIDLKIGEIYNTVVYIVETGLRNPYKILKMNNIQGYIVPHINSCLNVKQNKFEI